MWRFYSALMLIALVQNSFAQNFRSALPAANGSRYVAVDLNHDQGPWEGWGSSLAWWGRSVGGTQNADYFADLIYTTKETEALPGLGLNIVRYNVGGGGINQSNENKGPKLQWQMDIHGYWSDPSDPNPASWNWSVDENQRAMMERARVRGANLFEMFSDSPMWWMNANRSTAGSDTGGDCLLPQNRDRFAFYLAAVARYAADHWAIRFRSVEPFNEPSANWWKYPGRQEGCHFDLATQQILVERLRRALDAANLKDVAVTAADENNMDAGLKTWNDYDSATGDRIGKVNVHGYSNGTRPYRGSNRAVLHRAVNGKRTWMSEYGDGDASGYTMAQTIIRDVKELLPSAWVYWQPVEPDVPEFGWGLINANYVDTQDRWNSNQKTELVRANGKFFVFGQFTRYLRPAFHLIDIADRNSIAAYDPGSHRLVIVKVTGDSSEAITLDLSNFSSVSDTVQVIATTTAPGGIVPDWKQHTEPLKVPNKSQTKRIDMKLYPKSVYTFVIEDVLR